MYARAILIKGVWTAAALLSAACSHDTLLADDDETAATAQLRAITFCGIVTSDDAPATRTDSPSRETLELQRSGFVVFASANSGKDLNLMYNQQVTYHAAAYPNVTPYWAYAPLKYWPTDISATRFYAFAPATAPDGSPSAIYAIGTDKSTDSERPYVGYCLNTAHTSQVTDLLYATATPTAARLTLPFQHALARVGIRIKTDSPPEPGTRILIESVTVATTGDIAKTAQFTISESPQWKVLTKESGRTYTIGTNTDDATLYAYIHRDVAYAPALPTHWQSAAGVGTESYTSLITAGDYAAYIYLIPQESPLTFTVTVVYHVCNPSADSDTKKEKATTATLTPATGRTHNINLTLNL